MAKSFISASYAFRWITDIYAYKWITNG